MTVGDVVLGVVLSVCCTGIVFGVTYLMATRLSRRSDL